MQRFSLIIVLAVLVVVGGSMAPSGAAVRAGLFYPSSAARLAGFSTGGGDLLLMSFPQEDLLRLVNDQGQLVREFIEVRQPVGLAISTDRVYVGSSKTGAVEIYDLQGAALGHLGAGTGEFGRPTDIEVSPLSGEIYVVDASRQEIRIFDPLSLLQVGVLGDGYLTRPASLDIAADGSVLVGDLIQGSVEEFDQAGMYRGSFTTAGHADAETRRPTGITRDQFGRVYVSDALLNKVVVYETDGTFITTLGSYGSGPGLMRNPLDTWVSPSNGLVVVADLGDREVEVFPAVP